MGVTISIWLRGGLAAAWEESGKTGQWSDNSSECAWSSDALQIKRESVTIWAEEGNSFKTLLRLSGLSCPSTQCQSGNICCNWSFSSISQHQIEKFVLPVATESSGAVGSHSASNAVSRIKPLSADTTMACLYMFWSGALGGRHSLSAPHLQYRP